MKKPGGAPLPWERIDKVLLDMDGTLLDRRFDDQFWLEHVPRAFAGRRSLAVAEAREELVRIYAAQEGTLNWTDIDYWSRVLDLDIVGLKEDLGHLVALHPNVPEFLTALRRGGKTVWLVTNAHPKTLEFKMSKINITSCFNGIMTSQDVGFPKEEISFWHGAGERIGIQGERTLFADDTVAVLEAAQAFGIRYLIHMARFSSVRPAEHSEKFLSIESFSQVMPGY